MALPLYTQTVIAFIWDFDRTLIPGYMQSPLFDSYEVDEGAFWAEVNGLVDYYGRFGIQVAPDTAYLNHLLTYVASGAIPELTNERLRELGSQITPSPGMPEFMLRTREYVATEQRFAHHSITVEHYVVSTGLRQMILGSVFGDAVDGIWACEFIEDPASPGYIDAAELTAKGEGQISQVGYMIDNTTKTRALFEINKGTNYDPDIDVNARLDESERRVPFKNMIYVADGPSDVPVFSVVNRFGGRTLGVYQTEPHDNFDKVLQLEEDGRIQHMSLADYSQGSDADRWLMTALTRTAEGIVSDRERALEGIRAAPGHVTS